MGGPYRGRSRRIEERHGVAGARRTLGSVRGAISGPLTSMGGPYRGRSRRIEERHGVAGARRTLGSVRGHIGAPHVNGRAISGPLAPDRGAPRRGRGATNAGECEGGHIGAPHVNGRAISGPLAPDRGAPRRGRGATNAGECEGPYRGPSRQWAGHIGAARAGSRSATAWPGRDERWGV